MGEPCLGAAVPDGVVSIGAVLSASPSSASDPCGASLAGDPGCRSLDRAVIFVADSSFAVIELLKKVSDLEDASLITRLRLDAALYDPAPEQQRGQKGRPRWKGARRPTLKEALTDRRRKWTTLEIDNWYGEGRREVEVCTDTAVWYHTGLPAVEIRWLLIRDPESKFDPQAFSLPTRATRRNKSSLGWFGDGPWK